MMFPETNLVKLGRKAAVAELTYPFCKDMDATKVPLLTRLLCNRHYLELYTKKFVELMNDPELCSRFAKEAIEATVKQYEEDKRYYPEVKEVMAFKENSFHPDFCIPVIEL